MSLARFICFFIVSAILVSASEQKATIRIVLSEGNPSQSSGTLDDTTFRVGFGRDGYAPEGTIFRGGTSLLGKFRVNAILTRSGEQFAIDPALIEQSGKSEAWLRDNLFKNMSAIDFDGDGKSGEYGDAFISLAPLNSETSQPFSFNRYKGVFRWYSYAIHGTQDENRVGKMITGGCINVGAQDLQRLIESVDLGDLVVVESGD